MITVYTKNSCPKCMMTKNVLQAEGIPFEAINVDEDLQAEEREAKLEEFRNLGFMSMPIVVKEGMEPSDYITGFAPDRLKSLKGND